MTAEGVVIRRCSSDADEERTLGIYNAVWPWDAVSMVEVESPKSQMREYEDHLALLEGEVVGSAAVAIPPRRPDVGLALVTVLPEQRGRGAGTSLYLAVSRWLAERGVSRIDAPVPEDDLESIAFAERRGFVEAERNSRLILELNEFEPPPVDPPDGVEVVTWAERPDLALGIYAVACEAYPDVPGERDAAMEPFDDWLAHDMQGAGDKPEATFVALAGGEVVGYAKFSLSAAQPRTAHHDMTGVKRDWRGRGIAGALKRAQLAWAKREGYERLVTQNEVRNEAIRRLNERLGYRAAPGRVLMRGPIHAAS
jgi:GNAT superfamily N-acetyltransferase